MRIMRRRKAKVMQMNENAEQDGKKDEVKDKKENEPSCSPYPTWIDYAIIDDIGVIGMREGASQ